MRSNVVSRSLTIIDNIDPSLGDNASAWIEVANASVLTLTYAISAQDAIVGSLQFETTDYPIAPAHMFDKDNGVLTAPRNSAATLGWEAAAAVVVAGGTFGGKIVTTPARFFRVYWDYTSDAGGDPYTLSVWLTTKMGFRGI